MWKFFAVESFCLEFIISLTTACCMRRRLKILMKIEHSLIALEQQSASRVISFTADCWHEII